MNIYERGKKLLNMEQYNQSNEAVCLGRFSIGQPKKDRQYILRMMIQSPETKGLILPSELLWLEDTIDTCLRNQIKHDLPQKYIYVTVRHGIVTSVTDDEWHVDGFSMRKRHTPQQSYVWSDCFPTQYIKDSFPFPSSFDPLKHNIHHYFQDICKDKKIEQMLPRNIYCFDPYIVHRRPPESSGKQRTFVRISFLSLEIESDTCMQNPELPQKIYNTIDFRHRLSRFI